MDYIKFGGLNKIKNKSNIEYNMPLVSTIKIKYFYVKKKSFILEKI